MAKQSAIEQDGVIVEACEMVDKKVVFAVSSSLNSVIFFRRTTSPML